MHVHEPSSCIAEDMTSCLEDQPHQLRRHILAHILEPQVAQAVVHLVERQEMEAADLAQVVEQRISNNVEDCPPQVAEALDSAVDAVDAVVELVEALVVVLVAQALVVVHEALVVVLEVGEGDDVEEGGEHADEDANDVVEDVAVVQVVEDLRMEVAMQRRHVPKHRGEGSIQDSLDMDRSEVVLVLDVRVLVEVHVVVDALGVVDVDALVAAHKLVDSLVVVDHLVESAMAQAEYHLVEPAMAQAEYPDLPQRLEVANRLAASMVRWEVDLSGLFGLLGSGRLEVSSHVLETTRLTHLHHFPHLSQCLLSPNFLLLFSSSSPSLFFPFHLSFHSSSFCLSSWLLIVIVNQNRATVNVSGARGQALESTRPPTSSSARCNE